MTDKMQNNKFNEQKNCKRNFVHINIINKPLKRNMSKAKLPELDISHITRCGNLSNLKIFEDSFNFIIFYHGDKSADTVQAFADFNRQKDKLLPPNVSKRIKVYGFNVAKPNSQNNTITSRNEMCFRMEGYPLVVFFSNRMFCGKYLPDNLPTPDKIPTEFAKFCMKLTASACDRCIWERKKVKGSCAD